MSLDHGRPGGASALSPVLLGESPSHAEYARTLLAQARSGTLSTLALEPVGYPYASVVNFALDRAGDPVLLVSDLAEHTRNFKADPRASLLVSEAAGGDPLAVARVTLVGKVQRTEDPAPREAYLARHPGARTYVDFRDFGFYVLQVEAVRWIGGFGRMSWLEPDAFREARPDPVAPFAAGIREHMNQDHEEAMLELARHLAHVEGSAATLVGVDAYGFEMAVTTSQGPRQVRLPFPSRVEKPDEVRRAFIEMLEEAR